MSDMERRQAERAVVRGEAGAAERAAAVEARAAHPVPGLLGAVGAAYRAALGSPEAPHCEEDGCEDCGAQDRRESREVALAALVQGRVTQGSHPGVGMDSLERSPRWGAWARAVIALRDI